MLIPFSEVNKILKENGINIRGILHIGAHECEEQSQYIANGIIAKNIDWIEANPELVSKMTAHGIKVHNSAISDEVKTLPFYITNNGQSSSLLEFGTHAQSYKWCKVVKTIEVTTERLSSFIEKHSLPMKDRNFWNLDIQGVELRALKSADDFINFADAIYSEVNTQEVYKDCNLLSEMDTFLESKGFKRHSISMTEYGWGDALYIRV